MQPEMLQVSHFAPRHVVLVPACICTASTVGQPAAVCPKPCNCKHPSPVYSKWLTIPSSYVTHPAASDLWHRTSSNQHPNSFFYLPTTQGLEQSNPKLARIIKDDDIAGLQEELRRVKGMQDAHNVALQREQELLEADPFDPDVQKRIEELIQAKNIEENFAAALEHTPEVRALVVCGAGAGADRRGWCCGRHALLDPPRGPLTQLRMMCCHALPQAF
jgi:hypothetical protein